MIEFKKLQYIIQIDFGDILTINNIQNKSQRHPLSETTKSNDASKVDILVCAQKSTGWKKDRKDIGIGTGIGTNSYLYRNVPVINGILQYCHGIVTAIALVLSLCSASEQPTRTSMQTSAQVIVS